MSSGVQQPHFLSMGKGAYLFGGVAEIAFDGPGKYGRGRKAAVNGDLLDGFLRMDN